MSLARTPPGQVREEMSAEENLRATYRRWRRSLHHAKDYRVKVLRMLADDGDGEAAELLRDPARVYKASRCNVCAGCQLMSKEKPCGTCLGCERGRGCEEHHRRCADWPRNMHAHHAGSSITGISSQFDLAAADLSKYEAVLEQLRETDIEMEEAVDALAAGSTSRSNPRYDAAARARELDDEVNHLAKVVGHAASPHGSQRETSGAAGRGRWRHGDHARANARIAGGRAGVSDGRPLRPHRHTDVASAHRNV